MNFKTIKEKSEYLRELSDHRLIPGTPVILMVDGNRFSKSVKKIFRLPFDETFMELMDFTAVELCRTIQGAKLAYVQSDEISVLITDFDTPESDSWFGYRLCKMQSIGASTATAAFNRRYAEILLEKGDLTPENIPDFKFDCKAWNVPADDALDWFIWRQNDCTRNSKNQTARCHFTHKELVGLNGDEIVEKLKNEKGVNWNMFGNSEKYGRIVSRKDMMFNNICPKEGCPELYMRKVWTVRPAEPFGKCPKQILEHIPENK